MGKGEGKGGAQLGKAVKGRSQTKTTTVKSHALLNEKQLNEDIRLLEEYENMNMLAEAQRLRLKKLQQQEKANVTINKSLLLNIYRKMMRLEKVDSLRKEIEILAQNHEREIDRKDAICKMLLQDLDDSEAQTETAQRSHMLKIAQFLSIHEMKIATLSDEFERYLKILKEEFNSERENIIFKHARETREMNGIIAAVEKEEAERIAESKQAHETEREEIRNKNLEGINELRINLENKIEDLEKQFNDAHQSYVDNTDQANKHFKELQAADKKLSRRINLKKRKIERFVANLQYWKKKIDQHQRECVPRNANLRKQKEAIFRHCVFLNMRMKKFRTNEAKKLTELTGIDCCMFYLNFCFCFVCLCACVFLLLFAFHV